MTEVTETTTPVAPVKKPSLLWKIIKRVFLTLFILILLIIGAGIFLAYKYEDEAKAYVISKLNERLNTKLLIQPKDINFSVLQNFPNASVDLRNLKMLDAIDTDGPKDTLMRAGLISLQFNIRDLFNKHYVIKRIDIKDVALKLWINKKGKDNFHFLKPSTDTSTVKDTSAFALDKIILKNIAVNYRNDKTKDDYAFTLNNAKFKGQFSSSEYVLETDLKLFVDHITNNKTAYIHQRNIALNTELDVSGTKYTIKKAELSLGKLNLGISGSIDHRDSADVLHLHVGGKNMDIQSACSWMSGKFKQDIEEFDSKGNFFFQAAINGTVSKKSVPVIVASFGVSKGEVRQTKEDLTMKNVELLGDFSSAGKGKLSITHFSGTLPEGSLKGNFILDNFSDPILKAKAEGNVNLAELQKFLRIDTIQSLSGSMKIDASFAGHIRKNSEEFINEDKTSGEINFKDVNLRLRNNNLKFDDLSGGITLENNDIFLKEFKGKVSDSDFNLNGTFKNMLAWLLIKDEPLTVEATLKAKKIDLNELLSDKSAPQSKSDPNYKLTFSPFLDLSLNSQIDHLIFRKFDATDISGVLRLKDKRMSASPLSFRTMDGNVTINGLLDASRKDSIMISADGDLQKVNITKMFSEMENFGQNTLVDKNVKGTLTAKAQFAVPCGPDLTMNTAKMLAKCDVNINNGELIKLASLKSLSKFIKMSELEDIHFATLTTSLTIRNRIINLPETQVNSSAMDIEVSGTQDFDSNVDYVFGLYLSELLSKRARESRKENNDYGEEDTEGKHRLRLYISMKGPIDNPVIAYDHKAAQAERKEKRKEEKEKMKGILNEEFGLFKSDTTAARIARDKKKKKADKFAIKFDEDEKSKKNEKKDDGDF